MKGSGRNVGTEQREDQPRAIAIDGPVAAGKTVVGQQLAVRLGYRFIDTGMMYRALTVLALEREVDLEDAAALATMAEGASVAVDRGAQDRPERNRVLLNGVDVTEGLRSAEVGMAVSLVARVPRVREAMVALQRAIAAEGGVIMAGRDIGTVVLPNASLKVYLEASAGERARRRFEELRQEGSDMTLDEVRNELAHRDTLDSERAASPLRPADDAVVIQTEDLSQDQVVERILELAKCRS